MTVLEKRLLGLMQMDTVLCGHDGHIWVVCNDDGYSEGFSLSRLLTEGRVLLDNKIYGGILEALDTIDEALKLAGFSHTLESWYDEDTQFLGDGGVDNGRIDKCVGTGGIY